jgi:hypothetical protein
MEAHPVLGEGLVHRIVSGLQAKFTVEAQRETDGRYPGRMPTHRGSRR